MAESNHEGFPIKVKGEDGSLRTAEEIAADIKSQLERIRAQGGSLLSDSVYISAVVPNNEPTPSEESLSNSRAKWQADEVARGNNLL